MGASAEGHRGSPDDGQRSWLERARRVDWFVRPRTVLDPTARPPGWFPDGLLNACYNALDRHVVRGRADEPALLATSGTTGTRRTYSYADLLERVAQLAGGLRELGVRAGDRVLVTLPPSPEAGFALLACARLGAVHVAVPAGPDPEALAAEIDDVQPTVVLAASCGHRGGSVVEHKPLLDAALARSTHTPGFCVIHQRPPVRAELLPGRDLDFAVLMRPGQFEPASCVELASTAPLTLLGAPGSRSLRATGGYTVALTALMEDLGVGPDDVVLVTADLTSELGQVGVLGPLLVGAATVVDEGTDDARRREPELVAEASVLLVPGGASIAGAPRVAGRAGWRTAAVSRLPEPAGCPPEVGFRP